MCKITKKFNSDTFTGYKYVISRTVRGKKEYYSYWTGIKYKIGQVQSQIVDTNGNCSKTSLTLTYNEKMFGKTGVFVNLGDTKLYTPISGLCILKITIGGDLYEGEYDKNVPIVIGSRIIDIEEI